MKTFPADEVLGPVTWDTECRWWTFEAGTPGGLSISGIIMPEVEGALPSKEWMQLIRGCVTWLRDNEPLLRHRVAKAIFDYWLKSYYDEDIDTVDSPEAFAAAIRTTGINFAEECQAEVFYDDAGLFGNHGIRVTINETGEFIEGPDFA